MTSKFLIKLLLDSVFVISRIIKFSVRVISRSRRLRLITLTSTLIILDITKTSSKRINYLRRDTESIRFESPSFNYDGPKISSVEALCCTVYYATIIYDILTPNVALPCPKASYKQLNSRFEKHGIQTSLNMFIRHFNSFGDLFRFRCCHLIDNVFKK